MLSPGLAVFRSDLLDHQPRWDERDSPETEVKIDTVPAKNTSQPLSQNAIIHVVVITHLPTSPMTGMLETPYFQLVSRLLPHMIESYSPTQLALQILYLEATPRGG